MKTLDAYILSMLKDSFFTLTEYLLVAQRRINHNEIPLNSDTVQDAQEMTKLLRIKIAQLQHSN